MKVSARLSFAFLIVITLSLPVITQSGSKLELLKKEAVADVDQMKDFSAQMVDQVFSYGELGFQEFETSRYVTGILEKNGFRVERGVAGIPTAWVATSGSGKPVIAFITDIDCIPRASQKPGVAYHSPIVEGAPGHGEGHNSGMAVNVTAAMFCWASTIVKCVVCAPAAITALGSPSVIVGVACCGSIELRQCCARSLDKSSR